jgi:cytidine deaminase
MTTTDKNQLLDAAERAAKNSYVEYSHEPKGAALLAENGKVYAAACVENAAWGAAICAEASALSAAVGDGQRKFKMLAVAHNHFPCGTCLQSLREFGLNLEIITRAADGTLTARTLEQLLPNSFGPSHVPH